MCQKKITPRKIPHWTWEYPLRGVEENHPERKTHPSFRFDSFDPRPWQPKEYNYGRWRRLSATATTTAPVNSARMEILDVPNHAEEQQLG